jgi:RNA polymerase sigma-70 factor (ECF subfamily)
MRIDEVRLVREFQNGDDLAFVTLYSRYKRSIYVFCVKMLMDAEAARDCVQEVFLRMYERRDQLIHPERFSSWLFAIARNQCLTYHRSARNDVVEDVDFESLRSTEDGPDQSLERQERIRLVDRYLLRLKMEYREVLILREFQNLSYREIAEILGETESAIKSRIFKARQRLFELLRPILRERS